MPIILKELHYGVDGRHFSSNITTQFFWCWLLVATMNQYVNEYFKKCDQCQQIDNMFDIKLGKIGYDFTWKTISKLGFGLSNLQTSFQTIGTF
jgi:hypothetical protein